LPKKNLSKTMGADPETISRLRQMQEEGEEEEEESAVVKTKGGRLKGVTEPDTVKYSDEEDEGTRMSKEDLQVHVICVCLESWGRCACMVL